MIHFKNQLYKGFSFIEAIIALAIIAVVVSSFFLLQQKVFYRVVVNKSKIDRLSLLQNMMLLPKIKLASEDSQNHDQKDYASVIEKIFIDPETKVIYEKIPVQADSTLFRFEGLYQERVTAVWEETGRKKIADLYHYSFEIEEKKSETR